MKDKENILSFDQWTCNYGIKYSLGTTTANISLSNEWSDKGEYSLKGTSTEVSLFNQFIGQTTNPVKGLYEASVTIYNPMTNAILLLYNKNHNVFQSTIIPKSNTPKKSSIQLYVDEESILEVRVRINPTEIEQYIFTDNFNICER